jgi:hypothetical protein
LAVKALHRLVWLKYCAASGYRTMIVAEQATEAFTPHDLTRLTTHFSLWRDDVVTEALMIPLRMIMGEILVEHVIQRVFAQHHHMMLGFLLDRAHEPFAMGVEIGTPRR